MDVKLRTYEPEDFETLYAIDRACFAPGIAYTRGMLREFLTQPGTDCLVALSGDEAADAGGAKQGRGEIRNRDINKAIAGFLIAESEAAQGHIVTLDIVESARRKGIGTVLLRGMEERLAASGVAFVILETATSNEAGVAFWQRHGYRSFRVIRGYYSGRQDAYQMRKILGG
jgi:[ribosomal protein S18]-alanine N-acetyltransferase